MTDHADLLRQAIRSLEIQVVSLRTMNMTVSEDFEPGITDTTLGIQFKAGCLDFKKMVQPVGDNSVGIVRYQYECGFRSHDIGKNGKVDGNLTDENVVVEVNAIFSAYYWVKDDSISIDAISEFGHQNVGYHVWPYWRAFIQSHCAQANLPVPAVPFYQRPTENKVDGTT